MAGLIDLNTTEEDETPSSGSSAASFSSSASASASSVCLELWHACAGPMISLPKKGSVVVYFPQGHLEHCQDFPLSNNNVINIPPHVFCRVLDVKLHVSFLSVSLLYIVQIEMLSLIGRPKILFFFLKFHYFLGFNIWVLFLTSSIGCFWLGILTSNVLCVFLCVCVCARRLGKGVMKCIAMFCWFLKVR